MKKSRFQIGSGCYKCHNCGHQTRDTGHGEAGCELCRLCYDYFGEENSHSDNGHDGSVENCPICLGVPEPNKNREAALEWHRRIYT